MISNGIERENELTTIEAHTLLKNFDPKKDPHVSKMPKVIGNTMYFFYSDEIRKKDDWRVDNYSYVNTGCQLMPNKTKALVKKHYFVIKDEDSQVVFSKVAYKLPDKDMPVIVHYIGDATNIVQAPHGNAKHSNAPFQRTAPSTLDKIKEDCMTDSAQNVYKKLSGTDTRPKNTKQCRNAKYFANKNKRLPYDELYNCHVIASEVNCVAEIMTYPDVRMIVCDKQLLIEINTYMSTTDHKVMFVYDTTFNLWNYYVSPLLCKFGLFEKDPVVPVCFFIHEKKDVRSHKFFFHFIEDELPYFNEKAFIVTDDELSFRKAIRKIFPDIKMLRCWNHLWSAMNLWVQRHNGKSIDTNYYHNSIKKLLQSDNVSMFNDCYNEETKLWDETFKKYFDDNILPDLDNLAKWALMELNVYNPYSGITTNISEGTNNLLKMIQNRTEQPVDNTILSLNYLCVYYHNEILRGFCDEGNFRLKPQYICYKQDINNYQLRNTMDPAKIVEYVSQSKDSIIEIGTNEPIETENEDNLNQDNTLPTTVTSKYVRAKWLLGNKKVISVVSTPVVPTTTTYYPSYF